MPRFLNRLRTRSFLRISTVLSKVGMQVRSAFLDASNRKRLDNRIASSFRLSYGMRNRRFLKGCERESELNIMKRPESLNQGKRSACPLPYPRLRMEVAR